MDASFIRRLTVCACLLCAPVSRGVEAPYVVPTNVPLKQFFCFDTYPRDMGPFNAVGRTLIPTLRYRMIQSLPGEGLVTDLERARQNKYPSDAAYVARMKKELDGRKFDLVIAVGDPAVRLMANVRNDVFPEVPALMVGCDARKLAPDIAASNTVVIAQRPDPAAAVANILRVLPDTTNIVVVLGDSPLERTMLPDYRQALAIFTNRVGFQWLNKRYFESVKGVCSNLPPHHAIFFASLINDYANNEYGNNAALHDLRAVANAPIFVLYESQFGEGVVGGPLMPDTTVGKAAADVAFRLMSGEKPESITVPVFEMNAPVYDGRELVRWHIDEARLPSGSRVLFRPPTAWEQYRAQILATLILIVALVVLVVALLVHRIRLIRAQREVLQQRDELAHLSRVTTVSALSGSLAHELNQPLGIILSNAQAAQELLVQDPPALNDVGEILSDIVSADRRAAEIIQRLRSLLKRGETSMESLALNELLEEVLRLTRSDLIGRGVIAACDFAPGLPPVTGTRVQIQQVALNLILNAADAMAGNAPGTRRLHIATARHDDVVRVTVRDEGAGLPADTERLFQAFFTTKPHGLGMGLAICRSIIAAHHGRIWAEPHPERGAIFHFELPVADAKVGP